MKNIGRTGNMGRVLLLSLMAASLAACGKASGEEMAMAQGMYADLVEQHNEVAEAYASVEDDSLGKELDEMAEKVESMGQQDIHGLNGAELDAIVEEMNGYAKEYEGMLASLEEIKVQEEGAEVYAVPVTLKTVHVWLCTKFICTKHQVRTKGKPDKGYGVSGWIGDIEYSEYFCNRRGGTLASGSNG